MYVLLNPLPQDLSLSGRQRYLIGPGSRGYCVAPVYLWCILEHRSDNPVNHCWMVAAFKFSLILHASVWYT